MVSNDLHGKAAGIGKTAYTKVGNAVDYVAENNLNGKAIVIGKDACSKVGSAVEYTGNAAYKAKDVTVGAVDSAVGATKGAYQKVASKVS